MQSGMVMDLDQKSESKRLPTSDSMLFFACPPFKRDFLHPRREGARKSTEEIERKVKMNFPKLFQLRDPEMTDAYSERSLAPSPLLPSDIPYQVQHALLVTTQNILEKCCYEFARKWFPLELEAIGWNCAEAVELTKWTRVILKHSEWLPREAFAVEELLSQDVLASVQRLRHTAVHRLRTTLRGVRKLIRDAVTFAEALRDSIWIPQLRDLLRRVEAEIKDKENKEYALDGGITAILQNQLDGIVLRWNNCNLDDEIAELFEMLPTRDLTAQNLE
ncbi:hypothetical protein GQ44DRAFT_771071 [Phaeosphaeriaceae sp. PMI808]|nr:hypothetical protein GQ44DRAFT_771071 [Phaeosphaeriaceae sp. PMI808]